MASWGVRGKGGGKGGRIADPTSLKLRRASGTRTLQGEKRCASFPLRPCGATADRRVCCDSSLSCHVGNFIGVKHASRVREGQSPCAQARSGENGGADGTRTRDLSRDRRAF